MPRRGRSELEGWLPHGRSRLGDRYMALWRHAGSRLGAAAPDLVPAGGIGVGRGAAGRLDRGADTAIQYPHIGRVPELEIVVADELGLLGKGRFLRQSSREKRRRDEDRTRVV